MAAGGTSKSWTDARANNISVANDFLKHIANTDESLSDRWGGSWVDVPEEEAASRDIFARLATYLAEVHLIKSGNRNAGKNFDSSTADACWNDLMRGNEQRFSKSKEETTRVGGAGRLAAIHIRPPGQGAVAPLAASSRRCWH